MNVKGTPPLFQYFEEEPLTHIDYDIQKKYSSQLAGKNAHFFVLPDGTFAARVYSFDQKARLIIVDRNGMGELTERAFLDPDCGISTLSELEDEAMEVLAQASGHYIIARNANSLLNRELSEGGLRPKEYHEPHVFAFHKSADYSQ